LKLLLCLLLLGQLWLLGLLLWLLQPKPKAPLAKGTCWYTQQPQVPCCAGGWRGRRRRRCCHGSQ
jgi:hypothetical protein